MTTADGSLSGADDAAAADYARLMQLRGEYLTAFIELEDATEGVVGAIFPCSPDRVAEYYIHFLPRVPLRTKVETIRTMLGRLDLLDDVARPWLKGLQAAIARRNDLAHENFQPVRASRADQWIHQGIGRAMTPRDATGFRTDYLDLDGLAAEIAQVRQLKRTLHDVLRPRLTDALRARQIEMLRDMDDNTRRLLRDIYVPDAPGPAERPPDA